MLKYHTAVKQNSQSTKMTEEKFQENIYAVLSSTCMKFKAKVLGIEMW